MIKQFAYAHANYGSTWEGLWKEKGCGRREGLGEEVIGREEVMSRGEG